MANQTIQVRNEELNEMRRKSEAARTKREQADRDLALARQRFQSATEEIAGYSKYGSGQIRSAVKEEERRVLRELDNTGGILEREIRQRNSELRSEIVEIRRSVARTNEEIDRVNERIHEVAQQYESEIRSIADRMRKQRDRARLYANQLQDILDRISELHPDLLTPGEFETLQETMDFAITDIHNEDYQAAIGLAQDNLPTAVELQARLERLNDEFNELSISIAESIVKVREQIVSLTNYDANVKDVHIVIGRDEFDFRYDGDIDHWTSGLFYQLCDSFDGLEERVRQEYIENMDLENMRIANRDIPQYLLRIDRCVSFANEEFDISCRVQGTAVRINDALTEDDTWQLTDSGFENDDDRQAYYAAYVDGQGNRSAIVVLPNVMRSGGKANGEAQFSIGTCDGDLMRNPAMCRVLKDAIIARLRYCNIDIRNETDHRQSDSTETFVCQINTQSEEIKADRLRAIRNQLHL